MPPKGSGRGGRGRGGGRGGATTARNTATPAVAKDDSAPMQDPAAAAVESSEALVVPKQENERDASMVADSSISASGETRLAPPVAASPLPSPQTVPEPSTRVPRQRLDTLKSAEPASRSTSPAVRRGASSRGKKPVALPSNTSRRSKEERDARNQAALARERERNKERDALAARKQRQKENEERRAQQRAANRRGGYSGATSGPFSMPSSRQDRKSAHRTFAGYGAGSGSRATRVKSEFNDAGPSQRSSSVAVKNEDGGYVSSDDEQDAEYPRKDIDFIEISSDEDEAALPGRTGKPHLPVRIGRKEHRERVVGINTEASTETSAKLLQQAEASGSASAVEGSTHTSHKGKGKSKDVEITGEGKPYKGMWPDPDQHKVKVKTEPIGSDEEMPDAEQIGIGAPKKLIKRTESPEVEKKPKYRGKSEPNLQTDEERAEWSRFQANLRHIRAELGPEDTPTVGDSGEGNPSDAAVSASKPSVRDNHVYLFQLPPIIPDLLLPGIKKEPSDQQHKIAEPVPTVKGEAVPIKKEEEFSNSLAKIPEGPRFASGRVGKLRVHQSGKTTLDWGGTSYELTPGNQASFLQEVVSIHVVPEKDRVVEEDAGEAISFGRVKGKFIVTPDFSKLLG